MGKTIIHDYASTDGGCDYWEALYPTEVEVIPAIGSKVYVVNKSGKEIYGFEVYAKGNNFFIPKGADDFKKEYQEIFFDECGSRWFFDLDEAKAKLEEYLTDEVEIVEGEEDFWYVEKV